MSKPTRVPLGLLTLAVWLIVGHAAANGLTFSVGLAPLTPSAPTLTLAAALPVATLDRTAAPGLPAAIRLQARADLGIALDFTHAPGLTLAAIGDIDLGGSITPFVGAGLGIGEWRLGDDARRFLAWHALAGARIAITDAWGARMEIVASPAVGVGLHLAAEITPWR